MRIIHPGVIVLALLCGCAMQPPAPAQLTDAERFDRDSARLKRIWVKRTINEVKGTPALASLPTIAVDESRGDWRQVGMLSNTGKAYKIAVSHQDPKVVYVAYGSGGIWATRDGGTTWRSVTPRTNNPNWYFTVAIDPTNDRRVFAGAGDIQKTGRDAGFYAVLVSEDGGATWKTISPPGLGDFATVRILVNPVDPRSIVVLTTSKLYRSDDSGATWRALFSLTFTTGPDGWGGAPDVVAHPTNFNVMLLAHPNHGLQRTSDGGVTWQALGSQVTDISVTVMAWSKSNPSVVYLQTYMNPGGQPKYDMRVWRSTDAGLTWQFLKTMTEFHQGRYDMSLAVDPADPNRVLAGNASYVVTSNAFTTYKPTYCCSRVDISDVQFSPADPTVVYIAADQGVYKATDRGENIAAAQRFDAGAQTLRAFTFDVAGDAANPVGMVNAADYFNFRGALSVPYGWTGIGGYEYTALHTSPLDSSLVFDLGGGQRLRRSTDAGVTWQDVDYVALGVAGNRPYHGIMAFHPTDANIVYSAHRTVWRSNQKGAADTWTNIGPPDSQVATKLRAVKVAKSNPNVIYALDESWGAPVTFYITQNGGASWTSVVTTDVYAFDVDIHPTNPAWAIYGSAFELKQCQSYGTSCTSLRMPPATIDTAYRWVRYSADGTEVWIGTDFGVYVTADLGATWRRVGHNIPLLEVTNLKNRNGRWYASNYQGVWELRGDPYGQPGTSGLTATSSPGGVLLAWTSASNAETYELYRDGLQVFQGTTGDSKTIDGRVTAGQRYCYRVGASNTSGSGARSAETCITYALSAGDTTPNAFSFTAATQAFPGRDSTSNAVSIGGIDSSAPISVGNGAYSIGCTGAFTSAPGAITSGQTVCLRHTSSALGDTAVTTTLSVGGVTGTFTSTSALTSVRAQVASYYRTILRREADAAGLDYWAGEAARVQALGVNVNETWYAMAGAFFTSPEYLAVTRSNDEFVTDLYRTFFNRSPDASGLTYWSGQVTQGLPREVALVGFMFSAEFTAYTQAIFGAIETRKELDTVTDFYRGLLARLPDAAGFNYWVGQFRAAQCQNAAAVTSQADTISRLYIESGEYTGRNRSHTQFVGDLYNAFLRRGGDLAGVQYWISQLSTNARTRENVRQQFVASPEFGARVSAVIAQGCLS